MFVKKSCQKTMFDLEFTLPKKMLKRIDKTWARAFKDVVMPLLVKKELDFSEWYNKKNGAPNTSVALLLGVLILKETFDHTDEETLEQLEYNLLWQYALDVRFEEAHICRKTLHNFRVKLLNSEKHHKFFNDLTKQIVKLFNLSTGCQRLDSTHVVGNMKRVGRLGLFVQTIEQFLFKLKRMSEKDGEIEKLLKKLPIEIKERYLEREGYFSDIRSSQATRKLKLCAEDMWKLLEYFKTIPRISKLKQFINLKRLFNDQCKVIEDSKNCEIEVDLVTIEERKDNYHEKISSTKKTPKSEKQEITVEVKKKQEIRSDSLQSPTDPDATYGHKGKGYEYQIVETCNKDNSFQGAHVMVGGVVKKNAQIVH